jgi:hypothetical protein
MILGNIDNNPELVSYLVQIAKHTAEITYYIASSTKAWHNIVTFVESTSFWLTLGLGGFVGYIVGTRKRG